MQVRNFNDYVLVRLTPEGRAHLDAYWEPFLKRNPSFTKKQADDHYETGKDGLTRFQLWELMHIFGKEMFNGNHRQMFANNEYWIPS